MLSKKKLEISQYHGIHDKYWQWCMRNKKLKISHNHGVHDNVSNSLNENGKKFKNKICDA
jgi:hypothetical protein